MNPTLKQNLTNSTTWFRLLFMLFFGLVFWVTLWVAALLMLFQFITTLVTGQANVNLHGFNRSIARYIEQIMQYLLFCTDKRPFPFSSWPPLEDTASRQTTDRTTENQSTEPMNAEPATDSNMRG